MPFNLTNINIGHESDSVVVKCACFDVGKYIIKKVVITKIIDFNGKKTSVILFCTCCLLPVLSVSCDCLV